MWIKQASLNAFETFQFEKREKKKPHSSYLFIILSCRRHTRHGEGKEERHAPGKASIFWMRRDQEPPLPQTPQNSPAEREPAGEPATSLFT